MADGDADAIERAILPHPDSACLYGADAKPPPFARNLANLKLKHLKPGDRVWISLTKSLVLDETYVNDDRAQITAPGAPLPFTVVRVQTEWLVSAAPVIAARIAAARRSDKPPAYCLPWSNDELAVAGLADEVVVGTYSLHPPKGFKTFRTGPGTWGWFGKAQDQERASTLLIMQTEVPDSEIPLSAHDSLNDALVPIADKYDEWQKSDPETGEIGGLKFARVSWAGVRQMDAPKWLRGQKTHGFVYLAIDGKRAITIMFQGTEPEYRAELKACNAAVLSWRKSIRK
ncbi:MAG: hypothetical protein HY290_07530 [Planctomycetia bacterium]|nr:hypothetical protein [Planctomycetia bacterium]